MGTKWATKIAILKDTMLSIKILKLYMNFSNIED